MSNYLVVLFKDRKKKRIIKKFITLRKAKSFFQKKLLESSSVLFPVVVENTKSVNYEIGIVELSSKRLIPIYLTDEFGRNVKVKLDEEGMSLFEISPYQIEEYFYDFQKKVKIPTRSFIDTYLKGDGLKMISTLNNKVVVQNDEKIYLFSFKNSKESLRFADFLTFHFIQIKRKDCLIIKDTSKAQKKYLYEILSKFGFDKKYLYRGETTHSGSQSESL